MNILVVTGIFPPDIGGPATYVPRIAGGLVGCGHRVSVLTLSELPVADDPYPFLVIRIPRRIWKPWRRFRTVWTILRLGRGADVLFVNGLALEAMLANLLLHRPAVIKVVGDLAWETATARGWVTEEFEAFQKKRYGVRVELLKALRSWWTRKADRVIAPSGYLGRWVASWRVPREKIKVIYNAVEPAGGTQASEVPLRTSTRIVTVGRLVPWKRIDHLIETVSRLEGLGLLVVGDGPERGRLEGVAEASGAGNRVVFAGRREQGETLALMAGCDLLVLNSTYEGLPHVALEAMSVGVPVVATRAGGTAEVVQDGENGRLVPTTENGVLGEILSELAASPSERRRLAEGAKRTAERFTFSEMVEKTEALLQAVSTGSPSRSLLSALKDRLARKLTRQSLDELVARQATRSRTLDIGCSVSPYARYFPKRIAIDRRAQPGLDLVGDVCSLPFKDGSVETVLCTEVLEHVLSPESAIAEIRRVLKAPGKLVLSTRFVYPIHDAPYDFFRFTKYGLCHLLRDFTVLELVPELDTVTTYAALAQRIAFQTDLKGGRLTRALLLILARMMAALGGMVKREYGDLGRHTPENQILATGYFVVAVKPEGNGAGIGR